MDEEDFANTIRTLSNQVEAERSQRILQQKQASTLYDKEERENIAKWKIDFAEELERIEHLLRKHIILFSNGNEIFTEPPEEIKVFNEFGVQEIMNVLSWYGKGIILSDFSADDINLRVLQFSEEFNDFIFNNYEKFGLTTPYRRKQYPMMHMNIVNWIEACYHRALDGNERDSLITNINIGQTEMRSNDSMLPSIKKDNKFSLLRPASWVR